MGINKNIIAEWHQVAIIPNFQMYVSSYWLVYVLRNSNCNKNICKVKQERESVKFL